MSTADEHGKGGLRLLQELLFLCVQSTTIRESAPIWLHNGAVEKLKPEWEEKMKKGNLEKVEKLKAFQEGYLEENPEMAQKIDPNFKPGRRSLSRRKILGKKKGSGGKGFWFHGI